MNMTIQHPKNSNNSMQPKPSLQSMQNFQAMTFNVGSNFLARDKRKIVFPHPGGPRKRVILHHVHDLN